MPNKVERIAQAARELGEGFSTYDVKEYLDFEYSTSEVTGALLARGYRYEYDEQAWRRNVNDEKEG